MSRQLRQPAGGTPTTGSALGTGLLALGAALGALILLWLLTNVATGQARAGGFVFGLFFLVLISLPLIFAGWYLRGRGTAEAVEAETFSARRGVLDDDRVVRRELGRELEQRIAGLLAASHTLPAQQAEALAEARRRLQEVARDVANPGYDSVSWLEHTANQLDDTALANVRRYSDLVLEEARRLGDLEQDVGRDPEAAARVAEAAASLAQHYREREALLGRGQRAAALTPQEMLAAGTQLRRPLATPLDLHLDDAVSYEGGDYLVRAILTYFAGGRAWKTYQLFDGKQERWLEARNEGADVRWYETRPAVSADGPLVVVDGQEFRQEETGSATVGIESAAGTREGVFVAYRRYTSSTGDRLVLERWPDGPRALAGRQIATEDLQLWTKPAAAE